MNTSVSPKKMIDTRVLLSTLWIVVMINMLKADILNGFIPGSAEELARTSASAGASIPQLMLIGAIMGQLGIAMIRCHEHDATIGQRVLDHITQTFIDRFTGSDGRSRISRVPHHIGIGEVEDHQIVLAAGRPSDLSFNVINQISLRVNDLAVLREVRHRVMAEPDASELVSATHGNAISIYFRDPNGYVIELTAKMPGHDKAMNRKANHARAKLDAWTKAKPKAKRAA